MANQARAGMVIGLLGGVARKGVAVGVLRSRPVTVGS